MTAELIITNARVWTVDASQPEAEAVAILGERIVAVGSAAEIEQWRSKRTRVIDARGRLLLPGFNDAHVHFSSGGLALDSINLRDCQSAAEFAFRIAERAGVTLPGEWITGGWWDEQRWVPGRVRVELPTRQLIDEFTRDIPVLVTRMDVHMVLANTAALNFIGITRDTPDPPGGEIVRDARGEPTGILKDAAMVPAYAKVPPISHERRLNATRRAMKQAARTGVTSVQDMKTCSEDMAVFAELAERGELRTRIYVAPPIATWEDHARLGLRRAFGSSWLRLGAVKAFADGSIGSATAYMFEPYLDGPHSCGLLGEDMIPLEKVRSQLRGIGKAGIQVCIHAIGDRAVSTVLDLIAELGQHDLLDRRFRIEHAQHVAPQDFGRFRDLGVVASMQPYHASDDGRWVESRLSSKVLANSYAWRTMLDHNVRLAFGTDWPIAPLEPLRSIHAAVTRTTLDGRHPEGWYPEQKLTVAEAVEAYTLGSAFAEFQENEKGSITTGKLADLVLLSDDIFRIEPARIQDVTVDLTIAGGRVLFESPAMH